MTPKKTFLEAIYSNPSDMTPRLMYADWLLEQGDERGEFIRTQIELKDNGACLTPTLCRHTAFRLNITCEGSKDSCRPCRLHERMIGLLKKHQEWSDPVYSIFRRGQKSWGLSSHDDSHGYEHDFYWRYLNGFVEKVRLNADQWVRHGREIIRVAPLIQRVNLPYFAPFERKTDSTVFLWYRLDPYSQHVDDWRRAVLPWELFYYLNGKNVAWGRGGTAVKKTYPSEKAALDDLSDACLRYAKS